MNCKISLDGSIVTLFSNILSVSNCEAGLYLSGIIWGRIVNDIIKVTTVHMMNCVIPTSPIPIILAIISSKVETEEIIISTILLVFSSITPLIT